jgi:hypothetical protein
MATCERDRDRCELLGAAHFRPHSPHDPTFTIKLRPGKTYTFVCDPHSDETRVSFTVCT